MSKNAAFKSAKGLAEPRRNNKQRRAPDLRIRRTRGRLSDALVELMQEKPIDKVTVQEATFYLHYSDKDDLFLCVLEDGMEMWSTALTRKKEKSLRVAAVMEFFAHAVSGRKIYRALIDSGRIHAFFELAQGYFARGIARRMEDMGLKSLGQSELDARSQALAGNLLALLKWWLDRGAKESPKAMDELFHRMVWRGLR